VRQYIALNKVGRDWTVDTVMSVVGVVFPSTDFSRKLVRASMLPADVFTHLLQFIGDVRKFCNCASCVYLQPIIDNYCTLYLLVSWHRCNPTAFLDILEKLSRGTITTKEALQVDGTLAHVHDVRLELEREIHGQAA